MDFGRQFLDAVLGGASKAYGTVDRAVFGGNLPGGAARIPTIPQGEPESPVKTAAKNLLNQVVKDKLNEIITQAAVAQPAVQALTQAAPESVKQVARNVSNALPLPINLFTRYYTGLGGKDVQADPNSLRQLEAAISGAKTQQNMATADLIDRLKNAEAGLQNPYAMQSPIIRKRANDLVAELKSDLNKYNQGLIQVVPRESNAAYGGNNPLTSTQTSVGRAWVKPTPGGYTTNEKYNFEYAGADYKQPTTNKLSDQILTNAVSNLTTNLFDAGIPQPAQDNPMTDIMRALVMKMRNEPSFDYSITVPR
jgi:hypothetical protein